MVERMVQFPARLREAAPRKGFITAEQYHQLASHAKTPWLRCLIAAAYAYGFRKGELLNLRVRQVNLLERWIQLEAGTTKNNEPRKVRMTNEVYQLMASCMAGKQPDDYVFPVRDPRKAWYALCAQCGLGTLTPVKGSTYKQYRGLLLHDFRRAAVRNLVRAGVPERVAMEISGHKTRSMLDRYNIVSENDLIRAAELIENGAKTGTKTGTESGTVDTVEPVTH